MPKGRPSDRLKDARADLYRGLVRDAAERVFAVHGFAKARVAQIAEQSGVSIGTIYRVFPGRKREIYRALQEHRGTALIGRTHAVGLQAWQQRSDLLDAILASTVALVEFFAEHPDYLRVVLREETAWGVGPERPSTEQTAMWREGMEGSVMAMRQGIADGILVDDDPEAMARANTALQQAHLGYWLEDGLRAPPAEIIGRLQRQFMRAFCRPEALEARGLLATAFPAPRKD